jgi:hypothetical protein
MPGFITRGVLVGDVRITIRDPSGRRPDREIEGVQKIHQIDHNIVVGFAGNIDAGFGMVMNMARSISLSIPKGTLLTEPSKFLFKWARRARHAWAHSVPASEKEGGCALLAIVAPRPPSDTPSRPTKGWTMRSPDFQPERIAPRTAGSIGSGAHVPAYAAELERLGEEFFNLSTFEIQAFEGMGGPLTPIMAVLSETIEQHEAPGVSPHLVACSVRWGDIRWTTNDQVLLRDDGNQVVRQMPPIVQTLQQWRQFKRSHGLADLLALA